MTEAGTTASTGVVTLLAFEAGAVAVDFDTGGITTDGIDTGGIDTGGIDTGGMAFTAVGADVSAA